MATNVPRRNLGGEAEPWGRSVDERLLKQQGAIDLLQTDVKNSFRGINASVSGVSRTLSAVQEQQEELVRQQEALEEQTNRLNYLVDRLPNQQIRGATNSDITGMGTSLTQVNVVDITIPSNHNYASVIIANNGYINPAAENLGYITVTVRIYRDEDNLFREWKTSYNNAASFYSLGNTYQSGFFVTPGKRVIAKIYVNKNNPADQFDAANMDSSMMLFSYLR